MHFTINYSTNGRLHLLLIRRHIIFVDLVGDEVLSSHAVIFFEVLYFDEHYMFVQYVLPSVKET